MAEYCGINHVRRFDISVVKPLQGENVGRMFTIRENNSGKYFVVKMTEENGVPREVRILHRLQDSPFIIPLRGYINNPFNDLKWLIFDFVECIPWYKICTSLSDMDIQEYLYQIVLTLHTSHARSILHRDIKPSAILFIRGKRHVLLSGWGHALFHGRRSKYQDEVGPPHYFKSPEQLLNYEKYDYAVDMWAVGCLLGCMIFRKRVMFEGSSEADQLLSIVKTLGSAALADFIQKYKVEFDLDSKSEFQNHEGVSLKELVTEANAHVATADAIDLLQKLLVFDPENRLSAGDAIYHPYFRRFHRKKYPMTEVKEALSDLEIDSSHRHQHGNNFKEFPDLKFTITKMLGSGAFSYVCKMVRTADGQAFAVKCLEQTDREWVRNEVFILDSLRGCPNIIQLYGVFQGGPLNFDCLVMEYFRFTEWSTIRKRFELEDIQHYCLQLLIALDACHSRSIMHRDVKPHNIVVNVRTRQLRLIDFGLAEVYEDGRFYSFKTGTPLYKAPELLLRHRKCTFAVDMWAFGCVMAESVFRKNFLFGGETEKEILLNIVTILGGEGVFALMEKYGITFRLKQLEKYRDCVGKKWRSLINVTNWKIASNNAIDLISRILVFDPELRLSAKQAMEHPFFSRPIYMLPGIPCPSESLEPTLYRRLA